MPAIKWHRHVEWSPRQTGTLYDTMLHMNLEQVMARLAPNVSRDVTADRNNLEGGASVEDLPSGKTWLFMIALSTQVRHTYTDPCHNTP